MMSRIGINRLGTFSRCFGLLKSINRRVDASATHIFDIDRNPCTECRRQNQRTMATLYTTFSDGEKVPFLSRPDIDVENIMGNIDRMKNNVAARKMTVDFEKMMQVWNDVQKLKVEVERLEAEKKKMNQLAKEINMKKGSDDEKQKIRQESKELRQELKQASMVHASALEDLYAMILKLPNFTHSDTPTGTEGTVSYSSGNKEEFQPWMKSHVDIGKENNLLSVGHDHVHKGTCYLQKEATILELALVSWMSDNLNNHGFLQLSSPDMFKDLIVEGCALNKDEVYSVLSSDGALYLAGSSIMSFAAYYTMMVVENDSLPERCFTVGRNYNPIYEKEHFTNLCQTQQSSMVHICGLTRDSEDESDKLFLEFLEILQHLFSQLEIHFRVVSLPSHELSLAMSRKSSIQMWLPSDDRYVEISSVGQYTDYISRRLKIQYPTNPRETAVASRKRSYCHMVVGTAINVQAVVAAVLEHCQQQDGRVLTPQSLKPFTYCHDVIATS